MILIRVKIEMSHYNSLSNRAYRRARGLLYLRSRWARFALVVGPGLVVMLADTDAGSIITAAQSGAQWGYRLLLLQLVLIPVLFMVQELTVRLGIVSGKGHGELIRDHFGRQMGLDLGRHTRSWRASVRC